MKVPAPRRTGTRGQNKSENASLIRSYYRTLRAAWGPQHWWPAHTAFEVIVGTFLTQNTAWTNVELALENLRVANLLSIDAIRSVPLPELERMIRPSGYFRQKAQRLKAFVAFLDCPTDELASRRAVDPERHRSRNRGFDSPLRRKPSGLRRRRLYPPHPRTPRNSSGENRL
jgi:hypothetical protein